MWVSTNDAAQATCRNILTYIQLRHQQQCRSIRIRHLERTIFGPTRRQLDTGSQPSCWKKSFPLSSTRMNAGKSTTSIL